MPIHAAKILVLGSEPLNVIGLHRYPKKAHPWPKPHLNANFGADRSGRELKESKKTEKGKERNIQWQTGCSRIPPTLTQQYVVLHARWSSGCSCKFQVSSKSVERFSDVGGRNLPFPIYLRPVAYITACSTVQAVILFKNSLIM